MGETKSGKNVTSEYSAKRRIKAEKILEWLIPERYRNQSRYRSQPRQKDSLTENGRYAVKSAHSYDRVSETISVDST